MRAAGKTTLGKALARILHGEFIDLDARIEARAKAPIREIFEQRGEAHFRDLETKELLAIAKTMRRRSSDPIVLATGGGVIERAANRKVLRGLEDVVWLQANRKNLEARLRVSSSTGGASRRPLLLKTSARTHGDPSREVGALLVRRGRLYRAVAKHVLRAGKDDAKRLAVRLSRLLSRKK
jgi:shikimate kinase